MENGSNFPVLASRTVPALVGVVRSSEVSPGSLQEPVHSVAEVVKEAIGVRTNADLTGGSVWALAVVMERLILSSGSLQNLLSLLPALIGLFASWTRRRSPNLLSLLARE